MFEVLRQAGALERLIPEFDRLFGVPQRADFHPEVDTGIHTLMVVDYAAQQGYGLAVRVACLMHDLGKGTTPVELLPKHHGHEERSVTLASALCARLKVPNDARDLALLAARWHGDIHRGLELKPSTIVSLLEKTDALRRPERFEQLLQACVCDFRGRLGQENAPYPMSEVFRQALAAVKSVDAGAIARSCTGPAQIPVRVHEARVAAVKASLKQA
jgi:tRNA nucleotidyltransferase (CCA-adding enzyme)